MDKSIGNQKTMGGARTMRSNPASLRFASGDVLLGRYRVTDELGQGGMGVVYRCRDEVANADIALKALPPEVAHNSGEMRRFARISGWCRGCTTRTSPTRTRWSATRSPATAT